MGIFNPGKRHSGILGKAAALLLVTSVSACSSDFSRFGSSLTTASTPTPNQMAILKKATKAAPQAFPGDVDPVTTASVARTGVINATKARASNTVRAQIAKVRTGSPTSLLTKTREKAALAVSKVKNIIPAARAKTSKYLPTGVTSSPLPAPYNPPKIAPAASVAAAPVASKVLKVPELRSASKEDIRSGWTAAGGTYIKLKQGENLYDLSRRFGVPVKQIVRVNKLGSAGRYKSGQKILIPTFALENSAPAAVPAKKSTSIAALTRANPTPVVKVAQPKKIAIAVPRSRPASKKVRVISTASKKKTIVSSKSSGRIHTVNSGDTLYGISLKYKVSVAALKSANGMSGNGVRLGQRLVIPARGSKSIQVARAKLRKNSAGVDTMITGGVTSATRKGLPKSRPVNPPKRATYTSPEASAEIARRASEKVNAPSGTGVGKFRWPVKGRIINAFGSKVNGNTNDGIDISVPIGTAVKAAENGKVIYSGKELKDFGNLILVRHSNGWVSAYAHAKSNLVKRGDVVRRGQIIARSGRSGNAKRPKLHFELRKNSNPVNPVRHLGRG